MTLFTFEFTEDSFQNAINTGGISFSEQGVSFTLSVTDPLPTSYEVQHVNTGAGFLFMDQNPSILPNDTGGGDLFTLALTGESFEAGWPLMIDVATATGTWTIVAGTQSTTISAGAINQTFTLPGSFAPFSTITFTSSVAGSALTLDRIIANVTCFCAGTLLATPSGEVAIETLQPGDIISTADGGTTQVKWLGVQTINGRLLHPAKINPICIKSGAIAQGVPARDLFVSPDHAIEIGGLLINAGALVNGRTITQVAKMPLDGFTYYHVETDAHEVIVAEGCPAESYLDIPSREAFDNRDERAEAPPIAEMDLPRISAARLVPGAIRARILARAGVDMAA